MRLVPAPAHLAPQVLGACIVRGQGAAWRFPMPAHALAVSTVVLRGHLQPAGVPGSVWRAGDVVATGCATQAREFEASADLVAASLLCRATVLPALHGEAAQAFCDAAAPPTLLASFEVDRWCRLAASAADEALAAALFLPAHRHLHKLQPRAGALRFAQALAQQGGLRGEDGAPPAGWSERAWQRACQAELGLSPKRLQRLVRLHASVRVRFAHPGLGWAALAAEGGYCDQAHLAREYRSLAGVTPGASLAAAGLPLQLSTSLLVPRFFGR